MSPGGTPTSKLKGVVTALVTPLTRERRLDTMGMEALIHSQLNAGIDGIFILGSVGEGPQLPGAILDEASACAARCVGDRVPLLGGASDNSVDRCISRLERLASLGIRYGVVTLPFYGWPGRVGDSVRFFAEVAARSPIPVVAYNLPKAVGWQMPVEALEELFVIPNLVCIKDTHGDYAKMAAIASSPRRPEGFSYLPGNSMLAARLFKDGADGVVSTPANLFPDFFARLWKLCCDGRWQEVERLDSDLVPMVVKLLDLLPTGAASIKGLLSVRGICGPHTVSPWPEAGPADLETMREALQRVEAAIARDAATTSSASD